MESRTTSRSSPTHERLRQILRGYDRVLVAFSGGVDSSFLLKESLDVLGSDNVLAVLGVSPSLATSERQAAQALAADLGAQLRLLETHELEDENYASNPSNRCYFCKNELYVHLRQVAAQEGYEVILDGTNADDRNDHRPGALAAREQAVDSPLQEAGMTKAEIRELSLALGLPTWDKPEMPCLASRIPYGQRVDPEKLRQIEQAEACLRELGLLGGRVRHHGEIARIELPPIDLPRLAEEEVRQRLIAGVRRAGFTYVAVDLEGYRRGRLNEAANAGPRDVAGSVDPPTPRP